MRMELFMIDLEKLTKNELIELLLQTKSKQDAVIVTSNFI